MEIVGPVGIAIMMVAALWVMQKIVERSKDGERDIEDRSNIFVPLSRSLFCIDCEGIYDSTIQTFNGNVCPHCGKSKSSVRLSSWLNGKSLAVGPSRIVRESGESGVLNTEMCFHVIVGADL